MPLVARTCSASNERAFLGVPLCLLPSSSYRTTISEAFDPLNGNVRRAWSTLRARTRDFPLQKCS